MKEFDKNARERNYRRDIRGIIKRREYIRSVK